MGMLLVVILVLFLVVGVFLFSGFVWMVCLGVLAHIFDIPKLAIGFWSSVLVAVIVSMLLGGFNSSNKK